ncbi:MAG: hypothetical protein AABX29_04190 [Nanoarchaeota archaeon]
MIIKNKLILNLHINWILYALFEIILVILVSGCIPNYEQEYQQKRAYFESCLNNPDGRWDGDEQKCKSEKEFADRLFGEDKCIELKYIERAYLTRGTDYVIYFNDKEYYTKDFNLSYKEEHFDYGNEYVYEFTTKLNSSLCEDYSEFMLTDIHFTGWYDYRLDMPFCDGNDSITFKICEV